MPKYKLGKLAPKVHPKTLNFSAFLKADAPEPPEKLFREYKIPDDSWYLYGNDTIGDCTLAAVAHLLMLMTAHTGKMFTPSRESIIGAYSAITGYDPNQVQSDGTNPTDTGAAITDVLSYWQNTGIAGHKILAWAQIDYTNLLHMKQGAYIFGANDVGVQLPGDAQTQFAANQPWTVNPEVKQFIEGGHCIIQPGYGSDGSDYVTWGRGYQKATNEWNQTYVDEAYVVITRDWLWNADGLAPNSMNLDALVAAIRELRV
jgi:hypothetical protein